MNEEPSALEVFLRGLLEKVRMRAAVEKTCGNCEYHDETAATLTGSCRFPDPQRGAQPETFITAAMPDPCTNGKNCVQFRPARALTQ